MQKKAFILRGCGILLIAAILAWVLFTPREQPVPFELSPEDMRMPLRAITITVPGSSPDAIIARLRVFGTTTRFSLYIAPVNSGTNEVEVAAYRSDITMRGRLIPSQSRVELELVRTFNRVPQVAIDQGVEGLRSAIAPLSRARFEQTIFVYGDDTRLDPRIPILAVRAADIFYDEARREAVQRQLRRFAAVNALAIGMGQFSPDPSKYAVDIYGENIVFLGSATKSGELEFAAYRTGDRSAPLALFDQLFEALRRLVEEIDGVKFADHPLQR